MPPGCRHLKHKAEHLADIYWMNTNSSFFTCCLNGTAQKNSSETNRPFHQHNSSISVKTNTIVVLKTKKSHSETERLRIGDRFVSGSPENFMLQNSMVGILKTFGAPVEGPRNCLCCDHEITQGQQM